MVNQWVGPYKILRDVNAVLVEITPALFSGRSLVAHVTRLRLYTTPRGEGTGNVPDAEDLIPLADEEAEELENALDESQAVVPVKLGTPGAEIQDLPFLKKRRGRPPTARNSAAQTEEPKADPPTETGAVPRPVQQPGPSKRDQEEMSEGNQPHKRHKEYEGYDTSNSDMDYCEMLKRKQETSFKERFADLTKKVRFYKKRTRQEILSSGEEKPKQKREKETPTWQDLDLETDTDMESVNVIVELTSTSDVPVRGTDSAAAYDLRAKTNTKLEPGKVTKVPLKLQLAIPPN